MLAGLFLGSLTMLNILGVTRFVDLSFDVLGLHVPMVLAVGVLPYPVTFLCTDFISELYGRKRANAVVWMGLALNVWVMFVLWAGGALPGAPFGSDVFMDVRGLAMGGVTASMVAYLTAQFIDVWLFHFWKKLTRGRHLWLRNNGSTMVSQLVDSVAVILITYYLSHGITLDPAKGSEGAQLLTLILSSYVFKFVAALLDTVPFYFGVRWLSRWLELDPAREHDADVELA
ncbi:MAG: queuosine precursor transporter [Myxococcales bacterium]|nr:queuosine precursor transporter [Myxococcales bacterium]